ncbi:MAG: class I SAM-dependent methyltransferase [Bdellovibrionales bacterium]|jgi:cyclopropane fatty-acyl-phospholipid synthase-like methyltransferase|nr:class I SAM-dependent methyltransferase [Bdellovibrionales bacterium]
MNKPAIDYFNARAEELAQQYNALDRAKVHADLLELLPEGRALKVLDIGAGSGADAAMLADRGYEVTAAEPAAVLRALGEEAFKNKKINWNSEVLPEMGPKTDAAGAFDVVTSVGVFQYIDEKNRPKSLSKMFSMVAAGGYVEIQYPTPASREHQYTVSHNEIAEAVKAFNKAAAANDGIDIVIDRLVPDFTGRKALDGSDLHFRTVILQRRQSRPA